MDQLSGRNMKNNDKNRDYQSGQTNQGKETGLVKEVRTRLVNLNSGFDSLEFKDFPKKVSKPPTTLKKKTQSNAPIEHKVVTSQMKEK